MWEYRWVQTVAGKREAARLSEFGAEGWDAVGLVVSDQQFGETFVRILMKRAAPVAHINLLGPEMSVSSGSFV